MATQRNILELVQAANNTDPAPRKGRASEKSGTATDPYQRRLGSDLPSPSSHFILTQFRMKCVVRKRHLQVVARQTKLRPEHTKNISAL
jgi:hypothetical protein